MATATETQRPPRTVHHRDGRRRGEERPRTLLIESDRPYAAAIGACLQMMGCQVERFRSPEDALGDNGTGGWDAVVWGLPDPDVDNCHAMLNQLQGRARGALVVLGHHEEAAQGHLDAGAGHWLPKPFVPGALISCLEVALSRSATASGAGRLGPTEVFGMVLDPSICSLTVANRKVMFTRNEWDLLSILVDHPNRFLAGRDLLALGWIAANHAPNQLPRSLRLLRRKLEPLNAKCRLLIKPGRGLYLQVE